MPRQTNKINLHEALYRKSYDHAVICTFTFDPSFFEEYCLEKFSALSNNGNISVLVDSGIYKKAILSPESLKPKKANLRYLLHPVSISRGVFHPKITLLASEKKGRLIIGSSNFTRPGLTSNAEMAGVFDFEIEREESFKFLFQAVFSYLEELSQKFPGKDLTFNLNEMSRRASWLIEKSDSTAADINFLHNLNQSFWDQIKEQVPAPVDNIYILSRYFDDQPDLLDCLADEFAPNKIKIFTQNGVTNMTPQWLDHSLVKGDQAEILLCRFTDNGHVQPLHAKAIVFETDDVCYLYFGSANFTSPALFKTIKYGNAETLLFLPEISSEDLQPQKLFDPENTAVPLKDKSNLKSSISDTAEFETKESFLIKLLEATVNGEKIDIKAAFNQTSDFDRLLATLTFSNQAYKEYEVFKEREQDFYIRLSEEDFRRLNSQSTVIQLRTEKDNIVIGESNHLLVVNLKDIKTDRPVRRERYIKEAQQSAEQFFAVLRDLLGSSDNEALLSFLNFCDIPFCGASRPAFFRPAKTMWDANGMRNLGERNLKIHTELHGASIAFYDKHFKKLQRHINNRDLTSAPNFLHIFLAMGGVLRSQVERIITGLAAKNTPLTREEWSSCRNHLDTYYDRFKQLMNCLWNEYLSPILREYEIEEIREQFSPDLEPIHDLCVEMLAYRERLESLRNTKLRLVNPSGQKIVPNYFNCLLDSNRWDRFANGVQKDLTNLEKAVA